MTNADEIVGRHLLYAYDNGWRYELYVKNAHTIDYRIHSGIVGGRWVKDQAVHLVHLAGSVFKISWTEPTGTSVSLAVDLDARRIHGVIFFPQWVHVHPERTVCFQNEHLDEMAQHRDAGPTYPIVVVDEFAPVHFIEDCGPDDDSVIDCPPSLLPDGYHERTN